MHYTSYCVVYNVQPLFTLRIHNETRCDHFRMLQGEAAAVRTVSCRVADYCEEHPKVCLVKTQEQFQNVNKEAISSQPV